MQYYILPTNQDIVHRSHKYIDKKRGKNGKWVYYYTKKPSLKARVGVYAKEKAEKAKEKYYNRRELNYDLSDYSTKKIAEGFEENDQEKVKKYLKYRDFAWHNNDINQELMLKAVNEYKNTPIGKIESASENVKNAYTSGLNWLKKKLGIK